MWPSELSQATLFLCQNPSKLKQTPKKPLYIPATILHRDVRQLVALLPVEEQNRLWVPSLPCNVQPPNWKWREVWGQLGKGSKGLNLFCSWHSRKTDGVAAGENWWWVIEMFVYVDLKRKSSWILKNPLKGRRHHYLVKSNLLVK